jgi:2-polyprenyl-6-methoxyphenol hydroxylase-like FAD-dependent oxidoreductase
MNTTCLSENHAIVIGGSIAGLLAARVLGDRFDCVTVVERDQFPSTPSARRGVPQSVQPHVLMTRGYQIIEELLPDLGADLTAAGAIPIDWARDFAHFSHGCWNARASEPSHLRSFTCSRPLLEWAIRQRLTRSPKIKFLEKCWVTGLVPNSDQTRIVGVQIRSTDHRAIPQQLPAQLVIDASGRGTNALQWLANLGLSLPQKTVIDPYLGYATRRYRIPSNQNSAWKVLLIAQAPPQHTRLGYLAEIEAGEWIATLGGYGHDYSPLDESGFLAFAHSLLDRSFYEAIKAAEPTSPIYAHRATANRLYHYESTPLPAGFIALGDAVCALCPVYGQGMTVSALAALVLQDWLRRRNFLADKSNWQFQQQLAKSNAFCWAIATGQDSRFPTTQGGKEFGALAKLLDRYMGGMIQTAHTDPKIYQQIIEVAHCLKSPLSLYHPQVVWRVLQSTRAKKRQQLR